MDPHNYKQQNVVTKGKRKWIGSSAGLNKKIADIYTYRVFKKLGKIILS